MILSRIRQRLREHDWTGVLVEFAIVVLGVFVGLQVNLWNEARVEARQRQAIIDALVTTLKDNIAVHDRFVPEIDAGLAAWQAAYGRGEKPVPYYYRIIGSDVAPDVWATIGQMQLTGLFDPTTIFDLMFYYSELRGIGAKYVRYATFVEQDLLPMAAQGNEGFYDAAGLLLPRYRANMDRLQEFRHDSQRMTQWAQCLVFRLESGRTFTRTCNRSDYHLQGMPVAPP